MKSKLSEEMRILINVVVFGQSEQAAKDQADYLVNKWNENIVSYTGNIIVTDNMKVRYFKFNREARTIRFNEVYIDKNIKYSDVENRIITNLIPSFGVNYNWKNHVNYF